METKRLGSSIDLGTNTCLLLIAQLSADGSRVEQTLEDHSTIVRLGEGVDAYHELQPQAMVRTLKCLKVYQAAVEARGLDPASTIAVATSSSRDARNGAEFFGRVERETGFRFRIISGDEEAHATFAGGLLPGLDASRSAVIDIGGGSTEVIAQGGGQSVDIGSVRFTERYFKSDPVTDDQFWSAQAAVDEALLPLQKWRSNLSGGVQLVAVAGTAATLGAWFLELQKFDHDRLNTLTLTRGDVHRLVEELKWRTVKERTSLPGMEAKRADVLLAGALILWRAMELLNFPTARISTRGLRYGVFSQRS